MSLAPPLSSSSPCPRSNCVNDVLSGVQIVVRVVLKYTYIGSGGSRYPDDRRGGGPLEFGGGYERERGGPPYGEFNVHRETSIVLAQNTTPQSVSES